MKIQKKFPENSGGGGNPQKTILGGKITFPIYADMLMIVLYASEWGSISQQTVMLLMQALLLQNKHNLYNCGENPTDRGPERVFIPGSHWALVTKNGHQALKLQ